ncbi:MAG: sigma-70 family RNA polymerase sigma factor [Sedimentisphaerales bacterium]|nr:sigma-70 family RNA polymerase sigma factor [Sedimentisphaerales bacterium]
MRSRQKELLELLDKSGADLYALLTRLTLREDVAEELMQELFIKLNNSRGPGSIINLNAYARRAAINLAFDWRRSQKQTVLTLGQVAEPVSNDDSPLSKLIHSEELAETLDAVGRLRKASREVLVMRYLQQESYDNIAEQMGKSSHHVRALCSRAIRNLRDILGSNEHKPSKKEIHNVANR